MDVTTLSNFRSPERKAAQDVAEDPCGCGHPSDAHHETWASGARTCYPALKCDGCERARLEEEHRFDTIEGVTPPGQPEDEMTEEAESEKALRDRPSHLDVRLTESGLRIIQRAERIASHGWDYPEALRRSARVEVDPLGPEGVYGFGRCDRCGESFREDDEQAEVAGTKDDPAASILLNLTIHAGCITDSDVLA